MRLRKKEKITGAACLLSAVLAGYLIDISGGVKTPVEIGTSLGAVLSIFAFVITLVLFVRMLLERTRKDYGFRIISSRSWVGTRYPPD